MILYVGNKLSRHGNTPTSVETLGKQLASLCDVVTVSDKRSKILRLADMLAAVVRNRRRAACLLIDTYSTSNFYYALSCGLLARLLGVRYIPLLRGGELPGRLKRNPHLSRMLFGGAHLNVAPSHYLLEVFSAAGFRTGYIPNNIALEAYEYTRRETVLPRLLFVRAFSKVYNPALALDVLSIVRETFPDAELCMVGPDRDGTLAEVKAQCDRMGLTPNVRFAGRLEKAQWHALSTSYDIFINTTDYDNTPVSVIEAMALGLNVVSTDVGGIPHLVENGVDALTVPPGDAEAMARAVLSLIGDPGTALRLAENARKKVETFDWETHVKPQWIALLEGCHDAV